MSQDNVMNTSKHKYEHDRVLDANLISRYVTTHYCILCHKLFLFAPIAHKECCVSHLRPA